MKLKMILVLAAVLCGGAMIPAQAEAGGFYISIGDRPYYHGQHYYRGGSRYVWVPGHWEYRRYGRVWQRGCYVRSYPRRGYRGHHPYAYGHRAGFRAGW